MILSKRFLKPFISFLQYSRRQLVKSDRINALRKQYDAFMDEDKKRKERNDLILNKLDKMRYYNAPLTRRSTPTLHISPQTQHYSTEKALDKSAIYDRYLSRATEQHLTLDMSKKHLDDTMFLQEITQKYILIPKRSSMTVNEFAETIKHEIGCDSDWKSKYDILNELEQNNKAVREKEKEYLVKEDETLLNASPLPNEQKFKTYDDIDIPIKQYPIMQYANIQDNNINTNNLQEISNDNIKNTEIIPSNQKIYNTNTSQNECATVINDLKYKVPTFSKDQKITESVECIKPIEKSDLIIDSKRYSQQLQKTSLVKHDQNYTQRSTIGAVESCDLTNHSNNSNNLESTEEIEATQYPIDIINVQEFTPEENVILDDGVNINPHFDHEDTSLLQEMVQHESETDVVAVDSVDVSGIEAFDAEQREMFYSEQPSDNYSYDQTNPESTYQEYPQNENNYQQNEEYAYYEGVPQEQNYSAEVNEYEETSQPYDQTYQEQYSAYDPASSEQRVTYGQENQQNKEIQDNLSIRPEMEQLEYEQQNYETQDIEKQLDNEQGYAENADVEKSYSQLKDNTSKQDQLMTEQSLENSEIQENMIPEVTLNN